MIAIMNYNAMGMAITCNFGIRVEVRFSDVKGITSNEPDSDCEFKLFLSSYEGNTKFDYKVYT